MQNLPEEIEPQCAPLATRWSRWRAVYRAANLASHHVLGFTIKLVLLAYFTFAVLFLFLRYAILPHIDFYKGAIERAASHAVGSQVSINHVSASWQGLRPSLLLADVTLRDQAGQQVLSLPSVSATLSWWTVLAGTVRFESLELRRPALDVRRGADGTLFVAGLAIDTRQGGDGKGADWLLAQREIVIRDGQLRWTDQQRGAPPLALEHVNFVLRNQWRRHRFALHATPPATLAGPIDIRADFTHPAFATRVSDVSLWKGELYADLPGADLAAWKPYLDYPFQLDQGRGALRAWLTLDHAKLAGFTADIGLADVRAQLGQTLPPLDLLRVSGRISAKEDYSRTAVADGTPTFGSHGHSIDLSNFKLATRDGLTLPPTTLTERYEPARAGHAAQTTISAQTLDLHTLADLASRLPLPAAQHQQLADLAPQGRLLDFSAMWQGSLASIATTASVYRVQGKLAGLGLKAAPGRPGFDNLSGSIDATQQGGHVTLDAPGLVLHVPGFYAEPDLLFDKLALQASWTLKPGQQLAVQLDQLDALHNGVQGTLHGSYTLPLGEHGAVGPGSADFSGTVNNFHINTIGRYLPLSMPAPLRRWLGGALEEGYARDVSLRLRGDLAHFPFSADKPKDKDQGEFRITGRIDDGRLNYAPGELSHDGKGPMWPQAEHIKGSFDFNGSRMEIRGDTASTGGVALTGIKAVINQLGVPGQDLEIDGNASGAMPDYLKYVAASPVLGWIANFTDETIATGPAKLVLKLRLPLDDMPAAKVQGALALGGADVTLFDNLPPIQGTTGKIEFSERGVNLNNLAGTFLGGPVSIQGGTQADESIQVRIAGSLTADGLRQQYRAPLMQRLISHASGRAPYSGLITSRQRHTQVTVDSTLAGFAIDLPAPLAKPGADNLPVHFVLDSAPVTAEGLGRQEINIAVGNNGGAGGGVGTPGGTGVNVRYQLKKQGKEAWQLLTGGIGINLPAPVPDSGLMLNVNTRALDLDAWTAVGNAIAGPSAPGAAVAAGAGMPDLSQFVVPTTMAAHANELLVSNRKLQNVVVGATHQNGVWQANVDSDQANGYLTWADSGQGKVTARLSSLIIPQSAAADVTTLLEGKSPTQSMPSFDIIAEHFELFNKALGRLELQAYNAVAGASREWRVSKLSLTNPDGAFKASGKWVLQGGASDTGMNFVLDIVDAGKLLDRFGFAGTLRHGKGKLSGDIAWHGAPYELDLPSLSGKLAMNVESGQFLKQDPGAAKLLGVLSLQALPRLLKLDFDDVFSQGLAFDGITADATIMRGVAQTDNLKMHGLAATVLMSGSADIANETTDLRVVVIPQVNLGTGPLVYAFVNPVVGIGSYLAQLFLSAPVMKALTYQMQITGPWKSPTVVKLGNGKLEAQPSTPAVTAPGVK